MELRIPFLRNKLTELGHKWRQSTLLFLVAKERNEFVRLEFICFWLISPRCVKKKNAERTVGALFMLRKVLTTGELAKCLLPL